MGNIRDCFNLISCNFLSYGWGLFNRFCFGEINDRFSRVFRNFNHPTITAFNNTGGEFCQQIMLMRRHKNGFAAFADIPK